MDTTYLKQPITCSTPECGFTTTDVALFNAHSCDIGTGRCEDWPACGHELGDCNGLLYGSDEAIKARVYDDWKNGHGYCEHSAGIFNCDDDGEDED